MPRALFGLLVLVVLGGCPGVLAPPMDPVRRRCEALSWPASPERDDALRYLHREFAGGDFVTYKFVTDRHREELAECQRGLARLLDDPDPAVRRTARQTLAGLTIHTGGRAAKTVVPAVLRDAERLWRGAALPPVEAERRGALLAMDLDILRSYGVASAPALPLIEAIRAGSVLPIEDPEEPGAWGPPVPCMARLDEPYVPTVQDGAAELAWTIGGSVGPHPALQEPAASAPESPD